MAATKFSMAMDDNLASLGHGRGDPGSMSLSQASMHLKEYQTKADASIEGDKKKKRSAFWATVAAFESTAFLAFNNRELAKHLYESTSGPVLDISRGIPKYHLFEERLLEQISRFPSSFVLHHRLLSYWLKTSQISHAIRHIIHFHSASTGLVTNMEWTTWCSQFFDTLVEQCLAPDSVLSHDDWQPLDFQNLLIWRLKLKHQRCLNALTTHDFSGLVASFSHCLAETTQIFHQEESESSEDSAFAQWNAYQTEFEAVSCSLNFRALLLQSLAVSDRTTLMQNAWDSLAKSWDHPDMQKLVSWALPDHLWFYMDWPILDHELDIARLQRYSQDVKLTYLLLLSSTPAGRHMNAAKAFLKTPLGAGLNFDFIRLPPFATPQEMIQLALKIDMILLTHCGELMSDFDAVSKQLSFYFETGMTEAITVIFDYVLQAHRANVITNLDWTTFLLLNYPHGDERVSAIPWSTPLSPWLAQIADSSPFNVSPISLSETKHLWSAMVDVLTGKTQILDSQCLANYSVESAPLGSFTSQNASNAKQNILNPSFNVTRKANGFVGFGPKRPFFPLAQTFKPSSEPSKVPKMPDYTQFRSQNAGLSLSSHSIFLAVVQKLGSTLLGSLASERPSATSLLSIPLEQLLHILEWSTHRLCTSSNSPFKTGSFSLASEALSPESVVLADSPLTSIALPQYQTSEWMATQQAIMFLVSHVLSFSKHVQLPIGALQSIVKHARAVHANPDAMLIGAEAILIILSSADPNSSTATGRDSLTASVQSIHRFLSLIRLNMDDLSCTIMKQVSPDFETRLQKLDLIVQNYASQSEPKSMPATPSKTPIPTRSIQEPEMPSPSSPSKLAGSPALSASELQKRFLERLNGALSNMSKNKSQNIELPAIELEYLKIFSNVWSVAPRSLSAESIAMPVTLSAQYAPPTSDLEAKKTNSSETAKSSSASSSGPLFDATANSDSPVPVVNSSYATLPSHLDMKASEAVKGEDPEKQAMTEQLKLMQAMIEKMNEDNRLLQAQNETLSKKLHEVEERKEGAKRMFDEELRKIASLAPHVSGDEEMIDDESDEQDKIASMASATTGSVVDSTSAKLLPATTPTAASPKGFGFGTFGNKDAKPSAPATSDNPKPFGSGAEKTPIKTFGSFSSTTSAFGAKSSPYAKHANESTDNPPLSPGKTAFGIAAISQKAELAGTSVTVAATSSVDAKKPKTGLNLALTGFAGTNKGSFGGGFGNKPAFGVTNLSTPNQPTSTSAFSQTPKLGSTQPSTGFSSGKKTAASSESDKPASFDIPTEIAGPKKAKVSSSPQSSNTTHPDADLATEEDSDMKQLLKDAQAADFKEDEDDDWAKESTGSHDSASHSVEVIVPSSSSDAHSASVPIDEDSEKKKNLEDAMDAPFGDGNDVWDDEETDETVSPSNKSIPESSSLPISKEPKAEEPLSSSHVETSEEKQSTQIEVSENPGLSSSSVSDAVSVSSEAKNKDESNIEETNSQPESHKEESDEKTDSASSSPVAQDEPVVEPPTSSNESVEQLTSDDLPSSVPSMEEHSDKSIEIILTSNENQEAPSIGESVTQSLSSATVQDPKVEEALLSSHVETPEEKQSTGVEDSEKSDLSSTSATDDVNALSDETNKDELKIEESISEPNTHKEESDLKHVSETSSYVASSQPSNNPSAETVERLLPSDSIAALSVPEEDKTEQTDDQLISSPAANIDDNSSHSDDHNTDEEAKEQSDDNGKSDLDPLKGDIDEKALTSEISEISSSSVTDDVPASSDETNKDELKFDEPTSQSVIPEEKQSTEVEVSENSDLSSTPVTEDVPDITSSARSDGQEEKEAQSNENPESPSIDEPVTQSPSSATVEDPKDEESLPSSHVETPEEKQSTEVENSEKSDLSSTSVTDDVPALSDETNKDELKIEEFIPESDTQKDELNEDAVSQNEPVAEPSTSPRDTPEQVSSSTAPSENQQQEETHHIENQEPPSNDEPVTQSPSVSTLEDSKVEEPLSPTSEETPEERQSTEIEDSEKSDLSSTSVTDYVPALSDETNKDELKIEESISESNTHKDESDEKTDSASSSPDTHDEPVAEPSTSAREISEQLSHDSIEPDASNTTVGATNEKPITGPLSDKPAIDESDESMPNASQLESSQSTAVSQAADDVIALLMDSESNLKSRASSSSMNPVTGAKAEESSTKMEEDLHADSAPKDPVEHGEGSGTVSAFEAEFAPGTASSQAELVPEPRLLQPDTESSHELAPTEEPPSLIESPSPLPFDTE